ncbi:MAG: AAA ATPase [Alectoria fallacina]|uniref:Cell division control protein n=1 Tax=Alectoria fallacina TaxID=1903189 RepID=A0A8H3FZU6_9LECA|nr:MAG: AAA ATPase [Alectoria fallacina]
MASVLGKRARPTDSAQEYSSTSSRVKRRAYIHIANDENVDPKFMHNVRDDAERNGMDLYELDDSKHLPSSSFPVKPPAIGKRVALSPSKANGQRKAYTVLQDEDVIQLPTPKTPRHRDALSKRVPITPRHRVGLVGKPLTPHTPRTPSTPSNVSTVYNCARQLFTRSAKPGRLVEREEERSELHAFIEEGIRSKSGRCIYVSGPPGTGKSALVSEVCRDIQRTDGVKTAYINCMSAKCSKDIYGKLIGEFNGHDEADCDEMGRLRDTLLPKRKTSDHIYIVTLDEIDHLLSLDLEILYTLFQWSLHCSSRLILIGIANALDMTDRFLPRLKARNLKPQLLPFLPYTAPQIASVITTKLKSLLLPDPKMPGDYLPFLQPAAIQLCARKVASQSGDLRKAFDIIRRTIDLIEIEIKQKHQSDPAAKTIQESPSQAPLSEMPNLSSPKGTSFVLAASLTRLTPLTAPRATIAHVSRVSAAALSNGISQRLQKLNLQQKAALCALIYHQKTSRKVASSIFATPSRSSHAPNMRKLYETYCTLCKREDALHPLSNTEFADILEGLETLGLLGEDNCGRGLSGKGRTPTRKGKHIGNEKRYVSFVDEGEVNNCLEGVSGGILRGLIGVG